MDDLRNIDEIEWREEVRVEALRWLDSMKYSGDDERFRIWSQFNKGSDIVGSMKSIEAWIRHFFNLE